MPQKQSLTGKEAQTNVNLPLFLDFWILVKYANMPKYGNINKAMVSKEKQSKNSLVKIRVRVAATLFLSLQFSVLLLTSTNWIIQIFHPTQNICTSYISLFFHLEIHMREREALVACLLGWKRMFFIFRIIRILIYISINVFSYSILKFFVRDIYQGMGVAVACFLRL